jgi:hypothetical protein
VEDTINFLENVIDAVVHGSVPSDQTTQSLRRGLTNVEAKRHVLKHAQSMYHASRFAKMARMIESLEGVMFPQNWEELLELDAETALNYLKYFAKERESSTAYLELPPALAGAEANDALLENKKIHQEDESSRLKLQDKISNLSQEQRRKLQLMRESILSESQKSAV